MAILQRKIMIMCFLFSFFSVVQIKAQGLIWEKIHDTGYYDRAWGVTTDNNHNIIVVGESGPSSDKYGYVLKYNSNGSLLWTKKEGEGKT